MERSNTVILGMLLCLIGACKTSDKASLKSDLLKEMLSERERLQHLDLNYAFCQNNSWILMGDDTQSLGIYEVDARDPSAVYLTTVFNIMPWMKQAQSIQSLGFSNDCNLFYVKHEGGLDLLRVADNRVVGGREFDRNVDFYNLNNGDQIFAEAFSHDGSLLVFASLRNGKTLVQFLRTSVLDRGGEINQTEGYFQFHQRPYDFGGRFVSQVMFSPFGTDLIVNNQESLFYLPRFRHDEVGMEKMDVAFDGHTNSMHTILDLGSGSSRPMMKVLGFVNPRDVLIYDGSLARVSTLPQPRRRSSYIEIPLPNDVQSQNAFFDQGSSTLYVLSNFSQEISMFNIQLGAGTQSVHPVGTVKTLSAVRDLLIGRNKVIFVVENEGEREILRAYRFTENRHP